VSIGLEVGLKTGDVSSWAEALDRGVGICHLAVEKYADWPILLGKTAFRPRSGRLLWLGKNPASGGCRKSLRFIGELGQAQLGQNWRYVAVSALVSQKAPEDAPG
jgi:hypothetical protein